MRIKETFTESVNGKNVEVTNEGTKHFHEQDPKAKEALIEYLQEEIQLGKKEGWLPYNNFESSINWKII